MKDSRAVVNKDADGLSSGSSNNASESSKLGLGAFLERLGLQKYVLITLFTALAYGLTVGAYTYEQHGGLGGGAPRANPPKQLQEETWIIRRQAQPVYIYPATKGVAGATRRAALFDVGAEDDPAGAAKKLGAKGYALLEKPTDDCRFAFLEKKESLDGLDVAARILQRNQDCCGAAKAYSPQLSVYTFAQKSRNSKESSQAPVRGSLVYSKVNRELLASYVVFPSEGQGGFSAAVGRLAAEFGGPSRLASDAAFWEQKDSLLVLAAAGENLAVSVLHAGNVERHAERIMNLAHQEKERKRQDHGKYLAQAQP